MHPAPLAALLLIPGLLSTIPIAVSDTAIAREHATAPQAPAQPADLFAYDASEPLDLQIIKTTTTSSAALTDLTFASPKGGPITATLVVPSTPAQPADHSRPAILFLHWGLGDRNEFLPDATDLAQSGVVSLLIDMPFRRPKPWKGDIDPETPNYDRDQYTRAVVDSRRSIDLLLARPDIDPQRLAIVGHSYGAHIGGVLAGSDRRARACVLMGGLAHLSESFKTSPNDWNVRVRESLPPGRLEVYVAELAPIDAGNFIAAAPPRSVLFQWGSRDEYVSAAEAADYERAAGPAMAQTQTYDAGHAINNARASADRQRFLLEALGVSAPPTSTPDGAAMTTAPATAVHATGSFDVTLKPQTLADPAAAETADGPALGRMSIDKQFHGDLEATSRGEMLTAMGTVKGSAGYVAVERVTGTLAGRSGSFAFQHTGVMDRGTASLKITVVPDSGTGQLAGLTGTMTINIADKKHFYDFEYTLPPAP